MPDFILRTCQLGEWREPDDDRLDWAIAQLTTENWFAILTRTADDWFVQVAFVSGDYAIEYREGPTGSQFASDTADPAQAARFLKEFRAGDESYQQRHTWRRLRL